MVCNNKWYVVIDARTNNAIEYRMLDDDWLNMEGIWALTDDQLEKMYFWSSEWKYSVVSYDKAIANGVYPPSLARALDGAQPLLLGSIRSMRDPLLAATDIATLTDKWNTFDSVSQNKIMAYRQSLRDITNNDLTKVVWPSIPDELNFIRNIDVSKIARPSNDFLLNLKAPMVYTLDQLQNDVWERIKNERDRRKSGGVSMQINGKTYWFWTDEPTRTQYSLMDSMIRRYNLPADTVLENWKTMSGEFIPMTVTLLYKVIDSGIQGEKTLFAYAETLHQNVLMSADPRRFNYLAGWPQTYDEYVAANPT